MSGSGTLTRRAFLDRVAGAGAAIGISAVTGARAMAKPSDKPNIILIMADDMGYSDIGCYGGEVQTPNLDKLAANGLRFRQFYNNAKCGPTRASLLTGLYSQQVGEGAMRNAVTIAEALRPAGYRTLMTGKWHAPSIPVKRGFDRYFGLCDGCCNFWNPGPRRAGEPEPGRKNYPRRWAIDDKEFRPWTPPRKFYTTDAFTDYAIDYLDQYGKEDRPFFLYVAYTAPHYPLHAWPDDIAKYRGKYLAGWDALRKQRYKRMTHMGVIPKSMELSPLDPKTKKWADIEDKDAWDLKMAVYAAMIDRMDQNIGRLVEKVRALGKLDNTLFLFLADNGGCAESVNNTPKIAPGPVESYRTVELSWANASNTPFRKFKRYDHEGGISTPLVVHWPAVIQKGGQFTDQVGHIIDVMATCVDVAGATYPTTHAGGTVQPPEGKSLLPIFQGKTREPHEEIYWQFGRCKAVRQGKWKLVSLDGKPWELYDMETDRTELRDKAKSQPAKAKELAAKYDAWAKRCKAGGKKK